jgi:tripartite ATP-independent transporter DctP family solute receptor
MHNVLGRRKVFAATAASILSTKSGMAGRRLVRIANNQSADTPYGAGCRALLNAMATDPLLSGVLRPEIFDNAELGEELASVRSSMKGTIEIVCSSSGVLSAFVPQVGLLDTPFLFRDAAAARRVLDGGIGDELADKLKSKGVNVLAWAENGMRQMTANKPIREPRDLAGLKLRVPMVDVMVAGFRALGAEPRGLPFPQLHEALRTGDFDAEENPVANVESGRLYEVQKYLSLTRHVYSTAVFLVSQDMLDDLTPEQIVALHRCAEQGKIASRQFADAAERDGLARLRALGMTIVADVDVAAFAAAAKQNLVETGEKYGRDLMARLMAGSA